MKKISNIAIAVVALAASTALPIRVFAQQDLTTQENMNQHRYRLVDLGTLGGPNNYVISGFFESTANPSLSAAGTFAGTADTAIPDPFDVCLNFDCMVGHAVRWRRGTLTDLGTLPGPGDLSSFSSGISANGLIER